MNKSFAKAQSVLDSLYLTSASSSHVFFAARKHVVADRKRVVQEFNRSRMLGEEKKKELLEALPKPCSQRTCRCLSDET